MRIRSNFFKLVASLLVVLFSRSDLVYSDPGTQDKKATGHTLQVQTMFKPVQDSEILYRGIIETHLVEFIKSTRGIENIHLRLRPKLNSPHDGLELALDFTVLERSSTDNRIIRCHLEDPDNSISFECAYELIIGDNGSISLKDVESHITEQSQSGEQIILQIPVPLMMDSLASPGRLTDIISSLELPRGSIVHLLGMLPFGDISEKINNNQRDKDGLYVIEKGSGENAYKIVVREDHDFDGQELVKGHRTGSFFSVYDPGEINPRLGTKREFENLVNKTREMGYRPIIDLVGHFSPDSPIVIAHPEWMVGRKISNAEEGFSDKELISSNPGNFIMHSRNDRWLIAHNIDWMAPGTGAWSDTARPDWGNEGFREYMFGVIESWAAMTDGMRVDMAHLIPADFLKEALTRAQKINPRFIMIDEAYHQKEEEIQKAGGKPYAKYVHSWLGHPQDLSGSLRAYFESASPEYLKNTVNFAGNHDDSLANPGSFRTSQIIASTVGGYYMVNLLHILYGDVHVPVQATRKRLKDELEGKELESAIGFYKKLFKILKHPAFSSGRRTAIATDDKYILAYLAGEGENVALIIANTAPAERHSRAYLSSIGVPGVPLYLFYDEMNEKFYIRKYEELKSFFVSLKKDNAHIFFIKPIQALQAPFWEVLHQRFPEQGFQFSEMSIQYGEIAYNTVKKWKDNGFVADDLRGLGAKASLSADPSRQVFLRDLTKPDILSQYLLEAVLSVALTRKVVLAFDNKMGGLNSAKALGVFAELAELKKEPKYKTLLKNLEIVMSSPEALRSKLSGYIDDGAAIFLFARASQRENLNSIESKSHATYIEETDFSREAYYPLPEIVAITLGRFIDENIMEDVLKICEELNIGSIDEQGSVLIFKLLPNAAQYDTQELIKRYALLKELLRAA